MGRGGRRNRENFVDCTPFCTFFMFLIVAGVVCFSLSYFSLVCLYVGCGIVGLLIIIAILHYVVKEKSVLSSIYVRPETSREPTTAAVAAGAAGGRARTRNPNTLTTLHTTLVSLNDKISYLESNAHCNTTEVQRERERFSKQLAGYNNWAQGTSIPRTSDLNKMAATLTAINERVQHLRITTEINEPSAPSMPISSVSASMVIYLPPYSSTDTSAHTAANRLPPELLPSYEESVDVGANDVTRGFSINQPEAVPEEPPPAYVESSNYM